jgi:hypothetical protein
MGVMMMMMMVMVMMIVSLGSRDILVLRRASADAQSMSIQGTRALQEITARSPRPFLLGVALH